ncbi:hypothetical protein niasHT_009695 [Heterodera trifolii]|uniref:BTB domain-containing protein n=1 Tax=Heterodera trifolii TaxID=157864 RepID=A0ABD2MEW7_9BILA
MDIFDEFVVVKEQSFTDLLAPDARLTHFNYEYNKAIFYDVTHQIAAKLHFEIDYNGNTVEITEIGSLRITLVTNDSDGNDSDGNDSDGNHLDGNEPDDNDSDGNEQDGNVPDDNDSDGNEQDGNVPDDNDSDGNDSDGNHLDGNEPDDNDSDGNEQDGNVPDDNDSDGNDSDGNQSDGNVPDGNQPDGNVPDDNDSDGNDSDGNHSDGNVPDGNQPDGNEPDGNDSDGNEPDDNDSDGNHSDGNEPDDNDSDGNDSDGNEPDDNDSDGNDSNVNFPFAQVIHWQWAEEGAQKIKETQILMTGGIVRFDGLNYLSSIVVRILEKKDKSAENPFRFRSSPDDDFTVEIGDKKLTLSTYRLRFFSPVIDRMRSVEMREKQQRSINLNELGIDMDQFLEFLLHISTNTHDQSQPFLPNPQNVLPLLKLADFFQIDGLKSRCEAHLFNCVEIPLIDRVNLVDKYQLTNLKNFILRLDLDKLGAFFEANHDQLMPMIRKEILDELTWRFYF